LQSAYERSRTPMVPDPARPSRRSARAPTPSLRKRSYRRWKVARRCRVFLARAAPADMPAERLDPVESGLFTNG
jgi:hypothetical protein